MSETDPFYSEEAEGMSKRTQLDEYFSQSLEVDLLLRLCPDDEDTIYQIVDLLVDTCATNRKLLRDGRVRLKDCKSAKGKTYNATVLLSTEPDGRSKFSLEFEGGC